MSFHVGDRVRFIGRHTWNEIDWSKTKPTGIVVDAGSVSLIRWLPDDPTHRGTSNDGSWFTPQHDLENLETAKPPPSNTGSKPKENRGLYLLFDPPGSVCGGWEYLKDVK